MGVGSGEEAEQGAQLRGGGPSVAYLKVCMCKCKCISGKEKSRVVDLWNPGGRGEEAECGGREVVYLKVCIER